MYAYILHMPLLFLVMSGMMKDGGVKCGTEKLKGEWKGEFYQFSYGYDERYKMKMDVQKISGCKFEGEFHWYLTGHQVSSFTGEIKRDTVFVYENQQISGPDNLVLKGVYVMPWNSGGKLEGCWRTPDGGKIGGTFQIEKSGKR